MNDSRSLSAPYRIVEAARHEAIEAAQRLFREYANWLGVDLSFQGFDEELETLPGKYARPGGRLLLLEAGGQPVGCIALRRFDATAGEVKRLYVQAAHHGRGLGMALASRVLDEARAIGYRRLLLDTLAPMTKARALYRALGFREIEAYYASPLAGTVYMELNL